MIIRPRPSPLGLLVATRGSILPRIAPKILVAALVAVGVARRAVAGAGAGVGAMPFTLLGLGLSMFLRGLRRVRWVASGPADELGGLRAGGPVALTCW